jgi:hypothetical protein
MLLRLRSGGVAATIIFSPLEAFDKLPHPEIFERYRREMGVFQVLGGGYTIAQGLVMIGSASGAAVMIPAAFVYGGAFSVTRGIDNWSGGRLTQFGSDVLCSSLGGCLE